MVRRIDLIPSSVKLILALAYDLLSLSLAFYFSYIIRLGFDSVEISRHENLAFISVVGTTLALFYAFDVYNSVVRFFNAKAFLKIQLLLIAASIIFYLTSFFADAFVPRSVPIIFLVIASFQIAGARALVSLIAKKSWFDEREGVVIYGASSAGRQLVHALSQGNKYQPLAFLDEKKRYVGRRVLGLKIYSPLHITQLVKKHGQFKVLIAIPKVDPIRLKQIVAHIEPHALELLIVPGMSDIVSGKRTIDELREVSVDELLGRKPVQPIAELLSANITDKIVMVSGAGGSIGKELCRQIVLNKPKELILLDVSEALLYEIHQELSEILSESSNNLHVEPLIGNVQNGMLMRHIFSKHNVQTIYHAAAYKHVPMVENNVIAGVTNNVLGTYEIAQAAIYCQVETFVLISTDKAVRPTNVMGATKRLAELVLQGFAKKDHNTRFVMVRFGNVLGSSGSVVPLFKKQIKRGGPITITHPDIIRYFMTIPEAAQLVIQAGAMGTGGDVFVLDMGNPVKIVDLAYKMTHLMGLTIKDENTPNGDIEIHYSGLRPGEKLYEELLIGNNAEKTQHQRILTANERSLHYSAVDVIIEQLKEAMREEDEAKIRELLIAAPLDYQPAENSVRKIKANDNICSKVA
ncbi:polysaccharide biosynthesis protein [Colwellia sp. Arc7-635]|uniref:polysaccharide biosynthesis protein n=1 Tax=Colwellia sp. Arc7-635 TaxID=2497879 RepID=UPI000F859794|nr:nucleoside-diphosphate sugar epimerase/dehydratase [Colwellia sp. Arc7-635]AZQ82763.1 polysaccharide biosynthesis protein [Colwellia sp. Arc7-635]